MRVGPVDQLVPSARLCRLRLRLTRLAPAPAPIPVPVLVLVRVPVIVPVTVPVTTRHLHIHHLGRLRRCTRGQERAGTGRNRGAARLYGPHDEPVRLEFAPTRLPLQSAKPRNYGSVGGLEATVRLGGEGERTRFDRKVDELNVPNAVENGRQAVYPA